MNQDTSFTEGHPPVAGPGKALIDEPKPINSDDRKPSVLGMGYMAGIVISWPLLAWTMWNYRTPSTLLQAVAIVLLSAFSSLTWPLTWLLILLMFLDTIRI